jgi:phage/plasmid-like protein (TIGR03299 family)
MSAAIKRAGLDTTGGKISVMVAGEAAWHRLGVNVASAVTSADAIRLAGLEWRVEKLPLTYQHNGAVRQQKDIYALVRSDTGAMLGSVGSRYAPIQNAEGFEYLDTVLSAFGAKYATAGAVHGGAKVWMQAQLPTGFTLPGGDENVAYVMFTNSHDGTSAAQVIPTSHRTVCANTLRIACGDRHKGFSIRHTGDVRGKVRQAQQLLGIAAEGFSEYREQASALYRAPLDVRRYGREVLDAVLGVTDAETALRGKTADPLATAVVIDELTLNLDKLRVRHDELLTEILEAAHSPTNTAPGTAWGALQSATQVFQHGSYAAPKRGSQEDRLSRRFESVLTGAADEAMQTALEMALVATKA